MVTAVALSSKRLTQTLHSGLKSGSEPGEVLIRVFPENGKRAALRILSALLVAYLGFCAFLYARQSHFLFVPHMEVEMTPKDFGCKGEQVAIGPNKLDGFWLPGTDAQTLIYHHGNGGNVGDNAEHACRLNKFGFNVLVFDYRGYGNSKGNFPSEQRVYEDSEAAWDFATRQKQVAPREIILYGHSLGAAVAIEMATRHPNASGLIEESGFSSVYEMATRDKVFQFFPVSLLVNQRMDSVHKLPKIKMPVLIIHGARDKVIPVEMADELYRAANEPKQKLIVATAGHENTAAMGGDEYKRAVLDFARALTTPEAAQK
jgi:uncharacterized protein